MRRLIARLTLFTALLLSALFVSCKYDLISEPTVIDNTKKNPADYVDAILPPASVTASHGTYRVINLQWTGIENAVQYQIFAATTPFDTFEQIAETAGTETEISIDYPSGTTMYFAVSAVNYYGTVSSKSNIVMGSTLAVPIITAIEPSADSQSVKISWWMDNCDENTYVKQIKFEITAYDSKKKLIPGCKSSAAKADREVELNGLSPKTDYYFQVEAILYNTDDSIADQKSEKSDLTSASTTHSVVPKAVNNFSVSAGESTEYVILSWNAPEGADYLDSASNTYKIHPVAFYVQRKLLGSSDDTFETIDKISITNGQASDYEHYSTPTMTYDCSSNTTTSTANSELTITASSESPLEEYPQYIPYSTFVYKDKSPVRGKQYTYRVVTYTDDTKKQITAKSSVSIQKSGWKIGNILFTFTKNYYLDTQDNDDTDGLNISSFEINYNLTFNSFDIEYNYVIVETFTPVDTPATSKVSIVKTLRNISEVKNYKHNIQVDNTTLGKYEYSLYILNNTTDISKAVLSIEAIGSASVVDNTSKISKLDYFSVKDGYSDKYILYWNYISDYTYKVRIRNFDNDSDSTPSTTKLISIDTQSDSFLLQDSTAVYSLLAQSGDISDFEIYAYYNNQEVGDIELTDKYKTLGTAKPVMAPADYKTITITWDPVQMSTNDYYITACYTNTKKYDKNLSTKENTTLGINNDGKYECTITMPFGYDDPSLAGSDIKLSITSTSINNEELIQTSSSDIVHNLGPAKINLRTTVNAENNPEIFEEKIIVKWDAVDGANGYIISRNIYDYSYDSVKKTSSWIYDRTDKFLYDISGGSPILKVNQSEEGVLSRTTIKTINNPDGTITYQLTDNYAPVNTEQNSYEINQSKIAWGIPFGYIVIPVKNGVGDFNFGITNIDYNYVLSGNAGVIYNIALPEIKHASYGYGLQVDAQKAESSTTQEIKWITPYYNNNTPTLFRRLAGTNEDKWTPVENPLISKASDLLSASAQYDPNGIDNDASSKGFSYDKSEYLPYEYAIKYSNSTFTTKQTFVPSFIEKLISLKEDDTTYDYSFAKILLDNSFKEEQLNKGYLLNIPYSAGYGGSIVNNQAVKNDKYYSEKVSLTNWDYSNRALGPDSYTISIFNSDFDNNFYKVADFNKTLTTTEISLLEDTIVQKDGNALYLWPAEIKNTGKNTSTGLLKVLRDGKHYYSLTLKRNDINKELTIGDDFSIFGYRQITNEELCKTAMYIFAYGFYRNDGGDDSLKDDYINKQYKYGGANTINGIKGSAIFTDRSKANQELGLGKFKQYYTFTNYDPELLTPSGRKTSPLLKISTEKKSCGIKGDADNYIYLFRDSHDIIVKNGDEEIPLDYDATIHFTCSADETLKLEITRDNSTKQSIVSTKTSTERKIWFPMQIHPSKRYLFKPTDSENGGDSTDYGWWN